MSVPEEVRHCFSPEQDRRVEKVLLAYRQSRWTDAEQLLGEVMHFWHYAGAVPSWRYAYALLGVIHSLTARWMAATLHQPRPPLTVLLPGEDYDPATGPIPFLGPSDP